VVETLAAMRDGRCKALISLGGNLAVAAPDRQASLEGFRRLELNVGIATKLNRSHLLTGKGQAFILPCLGRTEVDQQASGAQSVTVEDSMSMVHASRGFIKPASPQLRSEPAIVAGIAKATLRNPLVDWDALIADYDRIRDKIEVVIPELFRAYNARIREPGGFRLRNTASERVWNTPTGKANFIPFTGLDEDERFADPRVLRLSTMRSHDQYNTTIYGLDDRYRSIFGRRDVVFMNAQDIARAGLQPGALADVRALHQPSDPGRQRVLKKLTVVDYPLPQGCCGAYYPEANCLVPLDDHDPDALTPSYKSVAVRITPAAPDDGLTDELRVTAEGLSGG
jgi:molybdopterin-dependent oxidoreductase alpha subunit